MISNPCGRYISMCTLAVALCGCGSSSKPEQQKPQETFIYEQRMGIARWRENKGCLAMFNAAVAPQTTVALVDQPASTDPPSVTDATVVERLPEACDSGLANPNSAGVVASFYLIATAAGAPPPSGIVIAILDPPAPPVVRDGRVEADLDGDSTQESFRVCNSAENVHFMAWTGSGPQAIARWRGVFYVGYDMTPTCTDQDVAGMVALDKSRASKR